MPRIRWKNLLLVSGFGIYHWDHAHSQSNSAIIQINGKQILQSKCQFSTEEESDSEHYYHVDQIPQPIYDQLDKSIQLKASDRLYSINGQVLSSVPYQKLLNSKPGSNAIFPLLDEQDQTLKGFVRMEILDPISLQFVPTTDERRAEVSTPKAMALTDASTTASDDGTALPILIRTVQEATLCRTNGSSYVYDVYIKNPTIPSGITWNPSTPLKSIVMTVDKKSQADLAQLVQAGHELMSINGQNVSNVSQKETAAIYRSAAAPRVLRFYASNLVTTKLPTAATKTTKTTTNVPIVIEELPEAVLECHYPSLIKHVRFPVDVAKWSAPLEHCKLQWLRVYEPISGCSALQQDLLETDEAKLWPPEIPTMYLTYRGSCTFPDKTKHIQNAKGQSMLLINNQVQEDKKTKTTTNRVKFPDTGDQVEMEDIHIPVGMIDKGWGEMLLSMAEIEPMLCSFNRPREPCSYSTQDLEQMEKLVQRLQEDLVPDKTLSHSHKMIVWKMTPPELNTRHYRTVNYIPALYGGKITLAPYPLVVAQPFPTACELQRLIGTAVKNAVVLVRRGKCSFTDKTRNVQKLGGIGIIIMNDVPEPIPLMSAPGQDVDLTIWTIMVGTTDGQTLEKAVEENKSRPTYIRLALETVDL